MQEAQHQRELMQVRLEHTQRRHQGQLYLMHARCAEAASQLDSAVRLSTLRVPIGIQRLWYFCTWFRTSCRAISSAGYPSLLFFNLPRTSVDSTQLPLPPSAMQEDPRDMGDCGPETPAPTLQL